MEITENMLLAGLIGGVVLVFLTLIVAAFTQAHKARSLTHAERMKAMEMGHPLPDDPETARIKAKSARALVSKASESSSGEKTMANQCYATTSYICAAGFFFAFVVGGPVAYALAAAAGAIGVTGMICGTILAMKEVTSDSSTLLSKPKFDPEAI